MIRINENEKREGNEENVSFIFKHSLDKKHHINIMIKIDFNDLKILDTADTDQKLLMKEMLRI
jgi:hypothetical protein